MLTFWCLPGIMLLTSTEEVVLQVFLAIIQSFGLLIAVLTWKCYRKSNWENIMISIQIYLVFLGNTNVCTKFNSDLSSSCWDTKQFLCFPSQWNHILRGEIPSLCLLLTVTASQTSLTSWLDQSANSNSYHPNRMVRVELDRLNKKEKKRGVVAECVFVLVWVCCSLCTPVCV